MKEFINPLDLFKKESPEIFAAFDGFIQSLVNAKALDNKTKQLLYIAMKIVAGDDTAVGFHLPMAKQAGASREELKETILLTLSVTGLKGIKFLGQAMELYD
jgi:alkylhydroperoxidase/carboxymuconolactone decarboxylase family protein YurZ